MVVDAMLTKFSCLEETFVANIPIIIITQRSCTRGIAISLSVGMTVAGLLNLAVEDISRCVAGSTLYMIVQFSCHFLCHNTGKLRVAEYLSSRLCSKQCLNFIGKFLAVHVQIFNLLYAVIVYPRKMDVCMGDFRYLF